MRYFTMIMAALICFSSCKNSPTTTASTTKAAERENPEEFLKVNYEVHRNLLGKKVVDGEVINTGKYLTYKSVTLRIVSVHDGDDIATTYTVDETIAPGGKAAFQYKPEGNPERVKVSVASAMAE